MRSVEDPDEGLSGVLGDLAASARRSNLARSQVLADALRAVADGQLDDTQRQQAVAAAHQLTGSAGTFGHHRASELAAALEAYFADPAGLGPGLADAGERLAALQQDLEAGQTDEP